MTREYTVTIDRSSTEIVVHASSEAEARLKAMEEFSIQRSARDTYDAWVAEVDVSIPKLRHGDRILLTGCGNLVYTVLGETLLYTVIVGTGCTIPMLLDNELTRVCLDSDGSFDRVDPVVQFSRYYEG